MNKPKKFVFVLMPFENSFDDIYTFGIKQTCIDLGFYCERVDEQIFHERILDRIYNQISKADLIVADMTNRNANVFYEVGYAHALGKNVILLTQNADDIPFDLKHFPHIIYKNHIKTLVTGLKPRLEWFLSNDNNPDLTTLDFGLEFLIEGEKIENGKTIVYDWGQYNYNEGLKIAVYNSSNKIYKSKFSLGLEMDNEYQLYFNEQNPIKPSTGRFITKTKELNNVYPLSYKTAEFLFSPTQLNFNEELKIELVLKIFTSFELKEIKFNLILKRDIPNWFNLPPTAETIEI